MHNNAPGSSWDDLGIFHGFVILAALAGGVEQGYPAYTEVKPGTAVNKGVSAGSQLAASPDASTRSGSAPATAAASGEETGDQVEAENSGPGGDNSGHGSSGGGGD